MSIFSRIKRRFLEFSELVLIKQGLFGLPWAIVGGLLPYFFYRTLFFDWQKWAYLLAAFFCARFSGMLFNRVIDKDIDVHNPRTAKRAVAAGRVQTQYVWQQAFLFSLLFFVCMWMINGLCLLLAPFLSFLIFAYAYTKRYTWLCHTILGLIYFFAPLSAWAAITGSIALAPILVGAAAGLSITASDIIYALQDLAFDREYGIYSIPAIFGKKRALIVAQVLYSIAVVCLIACAIVIDSFFFAAGVLAVALLYSRSYVLCEDSFEEAFTTANTFSGLILLLATCGGIWFEL